MRTNHPETDLYLIAITLPENHQRAPQVIEATYVALHIVAQARSDQRLKSALIVRPGTPGWVALERAANYAPHQRAHALLTAAELPHNDKIPVIDFQFGHALKEAALYSRAAKHALLCYQDPDVDNIPDVDTHGAAALARMKRLNAEIEATIEDFERWLSAFK